MQLLSDRNIYKNLEFVLRSTGWKDRYKIKERIDEALENLDPERINTLNMIISIGSAPDEDILREFLDMIQEYIDEGYVEWLTMTEQYERFLEWEE